MQGFHGLGAAALLGAALGLVALSSRAEDPPLSSTEGTKRADALFAEGMRFVAQQKWAEAEAKFVPARALSPSYDIAANLGQTQYRLGKYRDAAEQLAFALRHWPVVGKREPRDLAEKRLEELRSKVGMLRIVVNVAGAMVVVDGRAIGRSPVEEEVFVDAGARMVEARLEGYEPAKQAVEAAVGVERKVALALTLAKPVDVGRGVGPSAAPSSGPSVAPPPPAVEEKGGAKRGVLVAGGVTVGGALLAGVMLAVATSSKTANITAKRNDLVKQRGPAACAAEASIGCQELHDLESSRSALGSAAAWSFIGAGTVGATTLVYWLVAPKAAPKSGVQITPVLTARDSGFVVRGVW
jgi:hypothetical protein